MTGTTEEKNEAEIWGKLHHTFCNAIMASRHHQGRPMDVYKLCDVEQLKHELEIVAEKITSLTEERDKLKSKIDSNEYYCTKCSDCNWEGSSKFLRVSQFDECDISCPCCNSNNLVDSNKALNDDQSISNLRDYIDMQAFGLSKAEQEKKELKENNRFVFLDDGFDNYEFISCEDFIKDTAEDLRTAVAQGCGKNSLNDVKSIETLGAEGTAYYTFDGKDCHIFWNEQEALSSLNKSKGEEV